jgi:EmrB/QacA subfamily drug resistance transporter
MRSLRSTHRPLTVVAVLLGSFLAAMELTVVSTAMPTAVGDLGGIHLYAWAFAAYSLTATVMIPIFGKLADLRGRKPVLLSGIALFLAGSLACGQASSMPQLIAFRALQGLGAAAIQPISLTIVGDLFDVHQRARMQGIFGAVWGVAGLAGPLLGGAIVKLLSWRWVFYVNLAPGLACAAVLWIAYHERPQRHDHQLDFPGAVLLAGAVVSMLLAAGPGAVALWAAPTGLLMLGLFLWVELRAREPLLPLELFSQRVIAVASGAGALVGAAMVSTVTFVPLYVQSVLGGSPTEAGAAIAPMVIGWPIASALGGRLLPRLGYRILIRGGFLLSLVAGVLLALFLRPGVSLAIPRAISVLFGLGLGFANTPLLIAVQTCVPWNRRGVATASILFFRNIGGTLAVGILGAMLAAALADSGVPAGAVDQILGPQRDLMDPALLRSASGALQGAVGHVLWAVAAVTLAAWLVSLLFPPLRVAPRLAAPPTGPPTAASDPESR